MPFALRRLTAALLLLLLLSTNCCCSSSSNYMQFPISQFAEPIQDAKAAAAAIAGLDGIVEHGLFMEMVGHCLSISKLQSVLASAN